MAYGSVISKAWGFYCDLSFIFIPPCRNFDFDTHLIVLAALWNCGARLWTPLLYTSCSFHAYKTSTFGTVLGSLTACLRCGLAHNGFSFCVLSLGKHFSRPSPLRSWRTLLFRLASFKWIWFSTVEPLIGSVVFRTSLREFKNSTQENWVWGVWVCICVCRHVCVYAHVCVYTSVYVCAYMFSVCAFLNKELLQSDLSCRNEWIEDWICSLDAYMCNPYTTKIKKRKGMNYRGTGWEAWQPTVFPIDSLDNALLMLSWTRALSRTTFLCTCLFPIQILE